MNPDTNRFEPLSEALVCQKCGATNQSHYKKCLSCGTPIKNSLNTLQEFAAQLTTLVRPDGSPVPVNWAIFKQGEHVVIKDYTFKVGYIGDSVLVLEPIGPGVGNIIIDEPCIQCQLSGHCAKHI